MHEGDWLRSNTYLLFRSRLQGCSKVDTRETLELVARKPTIRLRGNRRPEPLIRSLRFRELDRARSWNGSLLQLGADLYPGSKRQVNRAAISDRE